MKTRWQGKGLYDVFVAGVDQKTGCRKHTYQWTRRYESRDEFRGTHIYTKTDKYYPEENGR